MKQSYAVMIPWFVSANTPKEALEAAIQDINHNGTDMQLYDGYVTMNDYTVEDMENAGWEYVEVS